MPLDVAILEFTSSNQHPQNCCLCLPLATWDLVPAWSCKALMMSYADKRSSSSFWCSCSLIAIVVKQGTPAKGVCMNVGWLVTGGRTASSYANELMDIFTLYFASDVLPDDGSVQDDAVRYKSYSVLCIFEHFSRVYVATCLTPCAVTW